MAKKNTAKKDISDAIKGKFMALRQDINSDPMLCKPEQLNARLAQMSTELDEEVEKLLIKAKK